MPKHFLNFDQKSSLVSHNITVLGRRTSVRLEPEMWRELKNISRREKCTIHDLCSLISLRKAKNTSLTAAIRVFLMLYFRAAATENGHNQAGHGDFDIMKRRAGMKTEWTALNHSAQTLVEDEIDDRLSAHLVSANDGSAEKRTY